MDKWNVPPSVAQKLRAIRRRAIAVKLLEGLVLSLAAFLAAMLAAMAVDWLVGWFDPRGRYATTGIALVLAATAFVMWCLRPLAHRHTIVSTAREVDESVPQLEERWSTVTELSQSQDAPEVRGSDAMIRKVASEAELASAAITPATIVSARPVFRASRWLAAAAALVLALFVVNFTETKLLFARFWMPGQNISLTEVSAAPADGWVPKGEPLTVQANVRGRVPRGPTVLLMRPEHGTPKQVAMIARNGTSNAFQHAINEVSDSFSYRVRSGDGQTAWHRITAVDRPKISEVKLKVTPPAYSKLPQEEQKSLPHALRVLQGTEIEVGFRSDQALDRMLLDFGNGQVTPLAAGQDNWFTFRIQPTNSVSFAAAAINKFKLENKNKPVCRVSVYEDLPPTVKILEPSDNLAVLPGEKVNVTFEAKDDFGIAKAEIQIETAKADGETNRVTIPVKLDADAGQKQIRKTVQLDPKALGLKHGDQLSYVVQVTDTRQSPAQAGNAANSPPQQASTTPAPGDQANAGSQQSDKPNKDDKQLAGNKSDAAEAGEQTGDNGDKAKESKPASNNPSSLAAAAKPGPSDAKPNQGSQPPPNEMAKRMLDAAQTSECKPRNIMVDEWAGSFEGEKRSKLEIAIDPVLKQLDALLAKAQENTGSLKQPAASTGGLQQQHATPVAEAKGALGESQRAIADLKTRTYGTPYAFIGLQLHNIGEAHIAPAANALSEIAIPATTVNSNVAIVDTALFHITRARAMLADLTKTYETVKRDQKIADAMQKLNKMYQIFLEDTEALLGSAKAPINSYDRKIAEVDEKYVEKLKELLEEKKKIMAELAKLLSEDPRMLRRYMAMLELQGTSYRDQMTLLAERQKELQKQVAKWNSTPESERASLMQEVRQSSAASQRDVVRDAAKLREDMETWLPLDMKPTDEPIKSALKRAEKIATLSAENAVAIASGTNGTKAGLQAVEELDALRGEISKLETLSAEHPKLPAYIANRLKDIDSLVSAESGATKTAESIANGDFAKVAEIAQQQVTEDTVDLSHKLEATQAQVSRMSEPIAQSASNLVKIVKAQIIFPQLSAVAQLGSRELKEVEQLHNDIVPAFDRAETTFDDLMKKIIAKLDEAPPPEGVGKAPAAEDLMKMLEDEMRAAENLGIPTRPINVAVMRDWMKPGSSQQGMGQGKAQAQGARAQAQDAKAEAQRIEKEARQSAANALAEARQGSTGTAENIQARGEDWNKLASRLQKDLLQGRDNTPPEQYRTAIENYFRVISENTRQLESK